MLTRDVCGVTAFFLCSGTKFFLVVSLILLMVLGDGMNVPRFCFDLVSCERPIWI